METPPSETAIAHAIQHYQAGRLSDAQTLLSQILQHDSNHAQALNISALIAHASGRFSIAHVFIQRALKTSPYNALFHNNLGMIEYAQGRLEESITALERAIELQPSLAEAHNNLATALRMHGDIEAARDELHTAIRLDPNLAEARCNLGDFFQETQDLPQAITAYESALAMQPNNAQFHMNLGAALLKNGDFPRGWAEYEWRLKRADYFGPNRPFPHPRWDGQLLKGRRILLYPEQGFGDTIQFVRYAPLVAQLGGKILVLCQPELSRLFQSMPSIDRVVRLGERLPPFAVQCPMMSLPLAFSTTLESIPANVPYLKPDPTLVPKFAPQFKDGLKIGLAWAGSRGHLNDRNRSVSLSMLSDLLNIPGVRFYSLQKGDAVKELAQFNPQTKIVDCSPDIHDFADTAAILSHLDLLITVDTAVAHLAGAMAKPHWLILPYTADFRWLTNRDDSPWYPTMRLFRQTKRGDWTAPVRHVTEALKSITRQSL
jgi:Tfp pilus assembly protein PilF